MEKMGSILKWWKPKNQFLNMIVSFQRLKSRKLISKGIKKYIKSSAKKMFKKVFVNLLSNLRNNGMLSILCKNKTPNSVIK